MGHVDILLLLGVLAVAVYTDLHSRRIPNGLVAIAATLALATGWAGGGLTELLTRSAGFAAGLLIFLPVFALRLVGAGDAKLMAVVGAFAGASALLPITLFTLIAGGMLGLIALLAMRAEGNALRNLRLVLYALAARTHGATISPRELGLASAARIPYAVAIAAGVVTWLLTRN